MQVPHCTAAVSPHLLRRKLTLAARPTGTPKLVLWLDASEAGTAASIDSGVWQDRSDYSNDLQLFNAGRLAEILQIHCARLSVLTPGHC